MAKEKSNNMKIKATPKKDPNIGIDTNDTFLTDLTDAIKNSVLDMSKLEGFTGVTQSRENIYRIIDTMAQDSIVSSILSTFAEDATETNTHGKIIWAEASDGSINNVVNYILNMLNVDKHVYTWAMYLVKYGDVYVRLFRQSDYEKDKVTASIKSPLNENLELLDENVDKKLEEDIKIVAYSKNDPYSYYVEAVQDPCGMFELTRHGKTMGYISAPINTQTLQNPSYITTQLNYKFNKQDVTIYPATEFVHGYLADTSNRTPEKISLYIDKDTADSEDSVKLSEVTYDVRRGQSILIPAFKAWRELSLLENSILLDRVTKSSIVRVISVEVGDMPKTQVQNHLQSIKSLMEQKSALNTGEYLNEYTNPGPIENNIYVPTRNSVGNISVSQIGGDVDIKSLVDLEHFQNKFFGSFGIPKQYFCLRGDTKLTLLNGEEITIKELFDNKDSYIGKGILSCNEDGSLEPTTITNIMLTRKDASFVRVYLDNGKHVDVTPDHRFMLRDGSYKEAQYLTENDSLMTIVGNNFDECKCKALKIENLPVVEDAYDIEVASSNHNFALTAGIFVHNCETSDNAGFSGGQSLAIISSRYGKKVKRIQAVLVQLVTDIINIYLMQKGLISYINKFNIKMNTPVTQEEIDKRDSKKAQIEYVQSVANLISDVQTPSIKLQIIKSLLSTVLENEEITALIQEEVDKLKQEEAENGGEEVVEEESITEEPYEPALDRDEDNEESSSISDLIDNQEEQTEPEEIESDVEEEAGEEVTVNDSYLPSPEELQVDLTRRI